MVSALPQPIAPPRQVDQQPEARRPYLPPIKRARPKHQDSLCGGTWTCWPNCSKDMHNKPLPVCPPPQATSTTVPPAAMFERKQPTGFTLFAVPPTPPVRKYYLTKREYIGSPQSSTSSSDSMSSGVSWSSDDSLPPLPPHTPPELLPAPLNIRKYRLSGDSSSSAQTSPCRRRGLSAHKRASIRNSIIYPPANLKRLSRNRSPTRVKRADSKAVRRNSRATLLGIGQKRDIHTSTSTNQWFDMDGGLVDRKKLSIYLGNVLGSSFQVPNLDHVPDDVVEPVTLDNVYGARAKPGPLNSNPPEVFPIQRPCTATKCECTPGKILCQGKSSPEFKIFTRWPVFRKSQLSVSSTACRLQVPRSHSDSILPKPRTPPKPKSPTKLRTPPKLSTPPKPRTPQLREIALSSSPPDLVYDNPLHSDDLDWSLLRSSPRETDVFRTSTHVATPATPFVTDAMASVRNTKRYSSAPVVRSQPPPSSYKPVKPKITLPQTPDVDEVVNSSASSFEFEFDYDSKRHFQQAPSVERHRISRQVLHRHLRHAKAESPVEDVFQAAPLIGQPAVARIASVALSVPVKPTLINHRTSNSPIPIPHDKDMNDSRNGRVQYSTRVQIKRPPSEIYIPKRRSALIDARVSQHGGEAETRKVLHSSRIHRRSQSRLTSDGSPVLGTAKLLMIT